MLVMGIVLPVGSMLGASHVAPMHPTPRVSRDVSRMVIRHGVALMALVRTDLGMLRIPNLDRSLRCRTFMMGVSMSVWMGLAVAVSSGRTPCMTLHLARTFPAIALAVPILPHGLYTESAVVVSNTSMPPTA